MSNEIKNVAAKPALVDAKEFAVAEDAAAESENTFTLTFRKPFVYQGKTYKELVFDWDRLTGKDGLAIENEMQQLGKPVIVPTFSGEYLIRMAARACLDTIGSDAFEAMPLAEYNRVRSAARSFLLKSER